MLEPLEKTLIELYNNHKPQEIFEIISQKDFDFNILHKHYEYGLSPLEAFAHLPLIVLEEGYNLNELYEPYKKIINFLLNKGVNFHQENMYGFTPIHVALLEHNYLLLESLTERQELDYSKVKKLAEEICKFYSSSYGYFMTYSKEDCEDRIAEFDTASKNKASEKYNPIYLVIAAHANDWINEDLNEANIRACKNVFENFSLNEQLNNGKNIFHLLCDSNEFNYKFYQSVFIEASKNPDFKKVFNQKDNEKNLPIKFIVKEKSILREQEVLKIALDNLVLEKEDINVLYHDSKSIKPAKLFMLIEREKISLPMFKSYMEELKIKLEVEQNNTQKIQYKNRVF